MKKLFLFSYALYLLVYLDSLQREMMIGFSHYGLYLVYAVFVFALLVWKDIKAGSFKLTFGHGLIASFLLYYAFMATHFSGTNWFSLFASVLMLVTIYFNYRLITYTNCFFDFTMTSFLTPTIYMLFIVASRKINLVSELSNVNILSMFSGTVRYRTDFGFYNINGTGNLVACVMCISLILLYLAHRQKQKLWTIVVLMGDAFLGSVILLSNSRNAILTVVIAVVVSAYFFITSSKKISKATSYIAKGFLIVVIVIPVLIAFLPIVAGIFISSERLKALLINIQVLDDPFKVFWGLGLISGFSKTTLMGHTMTTLDNYYLYTLISGGIIGLVFILWILTRMGLKVYNLRRVDKVYYIVFGIYVALVISGLGETCILDPTFPSCIIFWSVLIGAVECRRAKQVDFVGYLLRSSNTRHLECNI